MAGRTSRALDTKRDHSTGAVRARQRLADKLAAWPASPEHPPSRQVLRRVARKARNAADAATSKALIANRRKKGSAHARA